jgi:hypothetical protein
MPGNEKWVDWGKIAIQHAQKPQQKLKGKVVEQAPQKLKAQYAFGIDYEKNYVDAAGVALQPGDKIYQAAKQYYADWWDAPAPKPAAPKPVNPVNPQEQMVFFNGFNNDPAPAPEVEVKPFDAATTDLNRVIDELYALMQEAEKLGEEVPLSLRRAYNRIKQLENSDSWGKGWQEGYDAGVVDGKHQ